MKHAYDDPSKNEFCMTMFDKNNKMTLQCQDQGTTHDPLSSGKSVQTPPACQTCLRRRPPLRSLGKSVLARTGGALVCLQSLSVEDLG